MESLRNELAQGGLKESTRFAYLLAFVLLSSLAAQLPGDPPPISDWDRLSSVGFLLTTAVGTWWAYRQNGGAAGQALLERYLAIGWVLCMRFIALIVPLSLVAFVLISLRADLATETGPFEVASLWLIELLYYQRLGHHIRRVADAGAQGRR